MIVFGVGSSSDNFLCKLICCFANSSIKRQRMAILVLYCASSRVENSLFWSSSESETQRHSVQRYGTRGKSSKYSHLRRWDGVGLLVLPKKWLNNKKRLSKIGRLIFQLSSRSTKRLINPLEKKPFQARHYTARAKYLTGVPLLWSSTSWRRWGQDEIRHIGFSSWDDSDCGARSEPC